MGWRHSLLLVTLCAMGAGAHAAGKTVLDGVFSEAQAKRGQTAFAMNCMRCHADNLLGQATAPLAGNAFMDRWREDGLDTIFDDIRTRMPNDNPGALPENTYLDVLVYILQRNGFPAGSAELTTGALAGTQLVGKSGPQGLPSNSLVLAVGCAAAGPNKSWTLTQTAEPVRTKDAEDISADEKTAAAAKALGTQSYKLQASTRLNADFTFEPLIGHKVAAKGVLIRQENNDRISLSLLESLADTCAP